jgi:hypothetical protein
MTRGGPALQKRPDVPVGADVRTLVLRTAEPADLDRIGALLTARGEAADAASGEAVVSFFRYHLRLPYVDGVVGAVGRGGTMQAPYSAGGAGVAPDLLTFYVP